MNESTLGEIVTTLVDALDESNADDAYERFRRVRLRLMEHHAPRSLITVRAHAAIASLGLTPEETRQVEERVIAELIGPGPLHPLLADDSIRQIVVNGPRQVHIVRTERLEPTEVTFQNTDHLRLIVDYLLSLNPYAYIPEAPLKFLTLNDGSAVTVVMPPAVERDPIVTIRRPHTTTTLSVQQLRDLNTLSADMVAFLRACMLVGANVIVSGGRSTGKTTLVNVLAQFIGDDTRIAQIDGLYAIRLRQEHVFRMKSHYDPYNHAVAVSPSDLVGAALELGIEHLVVDEIRGGEALPLLHAMKQDKPVLAGIYATDPRGALRQLEARALMAGPDLPLRVVRMMLADTRALIVHTQRLRDNSRRVTRIAEISGMEGEVITLTDIFEWEQTGEGDGGRIQGRFRPTGLRPRVLTHIRTAGIDLPPSLFGLKPRN